MTTFHEAVVRIERIVEDVEESIVSHASECVVPVASAASALMMAGCLSTTDPSTMPCTCAAAGGSGGDRPDEAPVATAMADGMEEDPDTASVTSPTEAAIFEEDEEPVRPAHDQTPWWRRGPHGRRFSEALDEYPQQVLPHLRPTPPTPAWITPSY